MNDRHGRAVGDQVLVEVARRLSTTVRASDTVARLSGGEFALLSHDVRDRADVERVAAAVLGALGRPYVLEDDVTVRLSASLGVALLPDDGDEPGTLLRAADAAMYRARARGGSHEPADPVEVTSG